MKAIVFGINGQDGSYLNQLLLKNKVEVIGVSRSKGEWINGDIGDYNFVEFVIKEHRPDYIFHFAAVSTTKHSTLFDNHKAICTGTLNLLENVKKHCKDCKVFLSGSAMQFKNNGLPINESTPFEASSPYSVSRIHSVYAGRYYRNNFGLKVYVGYFFNHDSPLRTDDHINQKIVLTVKRISLGIDEKLEIGNLDVKKEFNYAGDIVEAVWKLVNQDKESEVIIGSGISYSIKDWLEYCFKKINKNWKDFVVVKKDFVSEYKILVSDPKLINSIGWQPKVDFFELADLMMKD